MFPQKFKVGEIVTIRPALNRNVPGGIYEVIKELPENRGEFMTRTSHSLFAIREKAGE